jgi:hypothetical protein
VNVDGVVSAVDTNSAGPTGTNGTKVDYDVVVGTDTGKLARVDVHGELDGSPPVIPGESSDQVCSYWGMITPSS